MKINGVQVINLRIKNGLYSCDIILDKKFLGHYEQSQNYKDKYSFDKNLLLRSMEAFKLSSLYKISYFKCNDDIKDFYTIDMFVNDLCDLNLDEQIVRKQINDLNKYIVIGESYIDNSTCYTTAKDEKDIITVKKLIQDKFNGSANIRVYDSMDNFIVETRGE